MTLKPKIELWLNTHGRPLEMAQFNVLFNGASPEELREAIEPYQTPEGGFGLGIEPDSLNPNPSPIQTWWAIHYLMDLPLEMTRPIHEKIIHYLNQQMKASDLFPALIPSNNEYPHAIWWHYDASSAFWGYNPSVALWAYLVKMQSNSLALTLLIQALDEFIESPRTEMHELKCFVDAYEWLAPVQASVPNYLAFKEVLESTLINTLSAYDPNQQGYLATPLAFCDHPKTQIYPVLKPYIEMQTHALKETIKSLDMWPISFDWNQYPNEFEHAKKAWMGIQAVHFMRFLEAIDTE